MNSCVVLALFTTPILSSIKDSTSTFDGSYGRCGQSDQLHLFEGKKSPALRTFGREMEALHVGLLFIPQSVGCRETNASLGCMNLKMRLKSFFKKTKTASMFKFTMQSLL